MFKVKQRVCPGINAAGHMIEYGGIRMLLGAVNLLSLKLQLRKDL
jgi:hypothetical protein